MRVSVFLFSRGCVYVCFMSNYEIIFALASLFLGLIIRPWRKSNKNSDGKLSWFGVIGWALIVVGGLLTVAMFNLASGLLIAEMVGYALIPIILLWLGYELFLFSRKYTIQQVLFGGGILIIGVALSLLGISVNEQFVLMCVILLMACLGVLLLMHRFLK